MNSTKLRILHQNNCGCMYVRRLWNNTMTSTYCKSRKVLKLGWILSCAVWCQWNVIEYPEKRLYEFYLLLVVIYLRKDRSGRVCEHVCIKTDHVCPAEFLWWHRKWWCNSIQSLSFFTHSLSPSSVVLRQSFIFPLAAVIFQVWKSCESIGYGRGLSG